MAIPGQGGLNERKSLLYKVAERAAGSMTGRLLGMGMPSFHFRAMTTSGAIVTGVLDASSERDAIQAIRGMGHYPIAADEDGKQIGQAPPSLASLFRRPVSGRTLISVTQELATLLRAGVELDRALRILLRLDETRQMHTELEGVLERVRDGASLADAVAASRAFPAFYADMVRPGEQTGQLAAILESLGAYLARAHAIRQTIASALVYPAIVTATAGFAIVFVLTFVLPQFTPLFAEAGKALPLSTRIVMAAGNVLVDWGWVLPVLALVAVVFYRRAMEDPANRRARDRLLLRVPVFGNLIRKLQIERFARTLGTLVAGGVSLPQALTITAETLSNTVLADTVGGASTALREGDSLASQLAASGKFPPLVLDLIQVGEESGQLPAMLLRAAEIYEQETRHTVDRLVAMLVPALTVIMGLVVAGLIASIMTAVLSVNDLAV